MKPETTLSDADLAVWGNFVKNKATPYNLRKYAQLLAYNGKVEQAKQQIFILQHLYRQQITLAELLKINKKSLEYKDFYEKLHLALNIIFDTNTANKINLSI